MVVELPHNAHQVVTWYLRLAYSGRPTSRLTISHPGFNFLPFLCSKRRGYVRVIYELVQLVGALPWQTRLDCSSIRITSYALMFLMLNRMPQPEESLEELAHWRLRCLVLSWILDLGLETDLIVLEHFLASQQLARLLAPLPPLSISLFCSRWP